MISEIQILISNPYSQCLCRTENKDKSSYNHIQLLKNQSNGTVELLFCCHPGKSTGQCKYKHESIDFYPL